MRRSAPRAFVALAAFAGAVAFGPMAVAQSPLPSLPSLAPTASAQPLSPTPAAAAQLSGPMASYAWFPGHWSCNSAVMLHGSPVVRSGTLWVLIDAQHDAVLQRFATTIDGKPYRSDETIGYDPKRKLFVQTEVDQNGVRIALAAKPPYRPSMAFDGVLGLRTGKLYRMRATMAIDEAGTNLTTSVAFYQPKAKGFVDQSRVECTKAQ